MDLLTLYATYKRAEEEKGFAAQARKTGRYGIAIDNDYYAKQYQRWDRLARKTDLEIRIRLGDPALDGVTICKMCGWQEHICRCKHPHMVEIHTLEDNDAE